MAWRMRSASLADEVGVVRGEAHPGHLGAQRRHLLGQDRRETVLDQAAENLAAGHHDAGSGAAQRPHRKHAAVLPGDGRCALDRRALHHQRDGAGGAHQLALRDQGVGVQGRAHHLIDHIEGRQRRRANLQEAVDGGRLVLVDFILRQVDDVEVVLAELLQVADVLVADRVPLAEGRTLELPGPDLGDVVRQLGPDRILQHYFFQHRFAPFVVNPDLIFIDWNSFHPPGSRQTQTDSILPQGDHFRAPFAGSFGMMPVIVGSRKPRHFAGRPVHVRPGDLSGV